MAAASRDQPSSRRRLPRWWWWRTRLAILVALLVVLAAAGVLHERREHGSAAQWYADWFRGGLRGPYGAFPRSLPGPPSHAVRWAAVSFAGPGGVYAGVSVTWADGDVAVLSLATGRTYWRRHRPGLIPSRMTIAPGGDLVLVQWSGFDSAGFVEALDLRSGKSRWRFDLSKGAQEVLGLDGAADPVEAGSGTFAFLGDVGVVAVSDGRLLWKTRWPRGCHEASSDPLLGAAGGALVAQIECDEQTPDGKAHVVGYLTGLDLITGGQRWKVDVRVMRGRLGEADGDIRPVVADVGGRVAVMFGRGTVLLDPQSGQVTGRTSLTGWSGGTNQDKVQIGQCVAKKVTAVCSYDTTIGRTVWTAMPPKGSHLLEGIGVYDGRIYVLLAGPSGPSQLAVLDQHTGVWQAQLPLPGIFQPDGIEPVLYKVTSSGVVVGLEGRSGPYVLLTEK